MHGLGVGKEDEKKMKKNNGNKMEGPCSNRRMGLLHRLQICSLDYEAGQGLQISDNSFFLSKKVEVGENYLDRNTFWQG